jgi:hypothetical protein
MNLKTFGPILKFEKLDQYAIFNYLKDQFKKK